MNEVTENQVFQIKNFISTKENNKKHSTEEITAFIKNLKILPQDEITKWLKAVKANGLDDKETTALTLAMANSGKVLSWEGLEPTIDKHSTGGIGDKVTLLFAPLIAAYGINIPKLSGRALGITGGTIDKLESFSGLKTNLTINEIKDQIKKIGLVIASAGTDLAPADKILYSIRDVTDTIDPIPLIASSIMSKKIAGGSKNIILDVKFGSGAFMKTSVEAKALGEKMAVIGKNLNRNIKVIISDMDEPLGYAIGNVLEVKEVLEVLSGKEVSDLIEVVIKLACEGISLIEKSYKPHLERKLTKLLLKGKALKKFTEMVEEQSGIFNSINNKDKTAKSIETLQSSEEGYIQNIDAFTIGEVVHSLGAGRKKAQDSIDHSVGILLHKKTSDYVKKGDTILEIHAKDKKDADNAKTKLLSKIRFSKGKPQKQKLIHEVIGC